MQEYRDRKCPQTTIPPPMKSAERWEDLDGQYGLENMFDDPDTPLPVASLQDEYTAYVNAPLSVKGTEILKFWEVCLIVLSVSPC
jgi:hypothetical protein